MNIDISINNTVRIFLIIVLSFLLTININANIITIEKAHNVAINFTKEHVGTFEYVNLQRVETMGHDTTIYIFDIDPHGFIIVSAEQEVYPVLGWSMNGQYDDEDVPPALRSLFDNYSEQILFIRQKELKGDDEIRRAWKQYAIEPYSYTKQKGAKSVVEPLLTSTWNQNAYYNEYCPDDPMGPNGKALAGCVATAMGQVMYYYRYPTTGTGAHAYYHNTYGLLYADFEATTYNWNEMGNTATSKSHLAIAELLYHLGVSASMNYSPTGSAASSTAASFALIDNFGYSSSLRLFYKHTYSDTFWKNMLRTQLNAGLPMYYHGFGQTSGHAFNLDGYYGTDHFHFNWGWGGNYDGYFYLSSLNPGTHSFTANQGAILNFAPPAAIYPQGCYGNVVITGMAGTIEDGSGPISDYQNNTHCSWHISPTDNVSHINISFDRFNTELGNDILNIYDGADSTAQLLASLSGDTIPNMVSTSSGDAYIVFKTNNSNTASGWLLSYEAFHPVYCNNFQVFTDPTGTFDDGSGTDLYNNNTNCKFLIKPYGNNMITLSFNRFALEDGYDYLRVYDPTTIPPTLLAILTGYSIPNDINVTNGELMLIFNSNPTIQDLGWEVTYTSTIDVEALNNNINIDIFPNPAKESVTIKFPENHPPENIFIHDITGKKIKRKTFKNIGQNRVIIDLSAIAPGIYIITISSTGFIKNKKLVIEG